ncbi:ATP-grasp domain-containing protein [Micromonospora sp. NPDC048170]|uniref:ATP-grasp domain-containing protein n=1 Tax=Micromonospora sp. NPDC048170 TaxID=3154819 RepID=UPI0033E1B876
MSADQQPDVILVGYGRSWLPHVRRLWGDVRVLFVVEPTVARAWRVREYLAADWPQHELYELDYRRPLAADLFHLWHPDLRPGAVVPIDDTGVVFAARLSERLGIPGAGSSPAAILADKWRLRQLADAVGVGAPQWRVARSVADAVAFAEQVGGEVVVKPSARAGSSGVEIVADPADIPAAWDRLTRGLPDQGVGRPEPETYLVERRVVGAQYSTNTLVVDGEVRFENVTGAQVSRGRHPVPLTHVVAPDLPPTLSAELRDQSRQLIAATGFRTGFVHIEWIVENGTPQLIEGAGRLPGGLMVLLIGHAHLVDTMAEYLAAMAGQPVAPVGPRPPVRAAVGMTKDVPPGQVTAVTGVEAARSRPGVLEVAVLVAEGDQVHELVSLSHVAARVAAVGETVEQASRAAGEALAAVEITTRPVEEVEAGT